jgi:RNA polymerase II subunit A small phosphatase-like protein
MAPATLLLTAMAAPQKPSLRQRLFSAPVTDRVPFYRKPSFLSRVVTKVVPCVSAPITPTFPLKDLSKPDLDIISPPLATPTDTEVIVTPPVSASLLPEDETDGVTSGAVQPPGSSGTEIVHTHSHDSDDSDHTSYTEDDHDLPHEDDEEVRLIKSGGSGIPIGLVRTLSSFL